mgnify:CR=1 FL=1|tara:strand:+ start:37 stop:639 length:603 start_codon:yes stop_codon:yes gene_type:complete
MPDTIIPIFPLKGVIVFPDTDLPLNIFEPKYLDMIDYSLSKDKLIGIIQPFDKSSLYGHGCIGKITNFNETKDGRYLISLRGLTLFTPKNEIFKKTKFRLFEVTKHEDNKNKKFIEKDFDKVTLVEKFKHFCKLNNSETDLEIINSIESKDLIKLIAMISPFNDAEKQMLLETKDLNKLSENIISLFDFYNIKNTTTRIN